MKKQFVSIIIPTYNSEKYLSRCLQSIREQNYPKSSYEILVIDGGSNDKTIAIAEKYKAKVLNNPYRNAESGKAIGINKARGEIIALIDSDNELVQRNWLSQMVKPLLENKDIFGVESRWLVNKKDPLLNQYFTLLQIADPLARRFHPKMEIIDKGDYLIYKAKIRQTPVVGANGFLYRKKLISVIGFKDKFEEVNFVSKLIRGGFATYAKPKNVGIYHYYSLSIIDYVKKRIKIGRKFLQRKKTKQDTWVDETRPIDFIKAVLYNISIIFPLIEAIKEYRRSKNKAWFWHPFFSFLTIIIYCYTTLELFLNKFFNKK